MDPLFSWMLDRLRQARSDMGRGLDGLDGQEPDPAALQRMIEEAVSFGREADALGILMRGDEAGAATEEEVHDLANFFGDAEAQLRMMLNGDEEGATA